MSPVHWIGVSVQPAQMINEICKAKRGGGGGMGGDWLCFSLTAEIGQPTNQRHGLWPMVDLSHACTLDLGHMIAGGIGGRVTEEGL